jgi:hypothetical protein
MREDKDNSAKWLIEHHGDAALRLGGFQGFAAWRPLQAELAHPRQLPDGLLEVRFPGEGAPDLFVVEVSTYPERRAEEQALRDAALVYLDRHVLPEVIVLVLHPRGNLLVTPEREVRTRLGRTRLCVGWTVVNLWTLSAEQLLAAQDVGVVPWVPLAQTAQAPEALLNQCREHIDRLAPAEEHGNLLAVTQVLAGLRYNDPALLAIFGGKQAMIESPVLIELLDDRERDTLHRAILVNLEARFGSVPPELAAQVRTIRPLERLRDLHRQAVTCPDLDSFRAALG